MRCLVKKRPDKIQERRKLVRKAMKLGYKYPKRYNGCAPATFMAIGDTLNLKGRNGVFKATTGFSGGIADMGLGACGAMAGATAAIGLKFGPEHERYDNSKKHRVFAIVEKVAGGFINEFGSYTCRGIQMKLSGKSFNLKDPEALQEFKEILWPEKCAKEVIGKVAGWTVEAILQEDLKREGE